MAKTKRKKMSVYRVVQRINQELAAKGQILMATRRMRTTYLGAYYTLDVSGNVIDTDIDPEKLARKLGVLS